MRSPEAKIFEEINLNEIHEKAEKFLKDEEIKIEEFTDLYGEENVKKDRDFVEKKEAEYAQDLSPEHEHAKKLSTILEAVIHEQVELNDWFGPSAITIKPSRFDDIKNGVDSIAEFRESEKSASYFALGVDATISSGSGIEKKFERIKKEIKEGKLAKVKYFLSEHMNIRGEFNKIPRVVIGADCNTVKELSELWINKDNKALEKHPIQLLILKEILLQCEIFKNYAKKVNRPEIVAIYEKSQKIVQGIYDKKLETMTEEISYDHVLNAIEISLKSF